MLNQISSQNKISQPNKEIENPSNVNTNNFILSGKETISNDSFPAFDDSIGFEQPYTPIAIKDTHISNSNELTTIELQSYTDFNSCNGNYCPYCGQVTSYKH